MAPSLYFIKPMPTSPMGQVGRATSRVLLGPDLMTNLFICEIIVANPWQAKAFVKALKKRLQNKNSKVQFLALTLLETMMQKCGDILHFQVASYEILQEMVKIIRKTRNMQVRDKILLLLETWQEAFGGPEGKYPQYYYTYTELKRSGVRFPLNQRDGDPKLVPFISLTNSSQVSHGMPSNSIERLDEIMESGTGNSRMLGLDLENMQSVLELFNNMLQVVDLNDHQAIKGEVITDLANQCSINQKKLIQLINSTEKNGILREALTLNDIIQSALSKYDALVCGLPSSLKKSLTLPRLSASISALSVAAMDEHSGNRDEEDGFASIAKRNSVLKLKGDQVISSSKTDTNTATSVSVTETPSSIASDALIIFDPPTPGSPLKKEEDMIDLLSLTIPENPSPPPNQNQNSFPPPNQNQNPFNDSPIMAIQNQNPHFNNHITPWAQPAIAQLLQPYPFLPTDYLSTPWTQPGASSNPFQSTSSTQTQYPASQQNLYSFGSKEAQFNTARKQMGPYMPDNLFEDLIELRNPDGSLKSRNASNLWAFSGQGRASVRQ